ncbi:outer membrane exchange protein TraA family protein [Myxococcus xanthus]|uniref:outer membrane exchange protein TraA family protein n=1 Tax=Myxococcus xanthus TaxID=34 RepID=UPI0011282548|nr:outer membrane exchange protein TraA family protein [Myxococcus xanthus]QDE84582.1 hypothetical protein BHS07_25195 [Myxococcus xanthus]
MRLLRVLLPLLCGLSIPLPASAQFVTVSGPPVAPLPETAGLGLCAATSVSRNPAADFPQTQSTYVAGINAFMEANRSNRVTSVLRTPLDLSNNLNDGRTLSYGDFTGVAAGCPLGGCDFGDDDDFTSFATRLRGFIAVTNDMLNRPLHFGFYADDSVSLTLFDRNQTSYPVINRPPTLGAPTWRATKTVYFEQPGLYGVEVLHTNMSEHSALEISMYDGDFADFERAANTPPVINLAAAGFVLVTPEMFHQTESGQSLLPTLTECAQCNRQFSNGPGNGGCEAGYRCNAAALCAPCDSSLSCGASCSPCGASTPYCVNQTEDFVCAQCRDANDCVALDECHLPNCTETGTCASTPVEDGTECTGGTCQQGECRPVDAGTPDAGGPGEVDGGPIPETDGGDTGTDGGDTGTDGGDTSSDGGDTGTDGGDTGSDGGDTGTDGGDTGTDGGTSTPDSGVPAVDAGSNDGGSPAPPTEPASGCGCQGGPQALLPMALLALARVVRRDRRLGTPSRD